MGHPARLLPQVLDSSLDAQVWCKILFSDDLCLAISFALIHYITLSSGQERVSILSILVTKELYQRPILFCRSLVREYLHVTRSMFRL